MVAGSACLLRLRNAYGYKLNGYFTNVLINISNEISELYQNEICYLIVLDNASNLTYISVKRLRYLGRLR
jgi:hypothetical protein